jgi:hypothetical protein
MPPRRETVGPLAGGPPPTSVIPAELRALDLADWAREGDPDGRAGCQRAHGRWLRARRRWERETRESIERIWRAYLDAVNDSARTLDELNAPYHPGVFVQDESRDPRWDDP